MKKNYFLIVFIALSANAIAQPIIESNDFLTSGYGQYYTAPTSGYTNGAPGENVWDFSFLPLTPAHTMSTVPLETVPFHEQFPTADYCIINNDPNEGTYYNLFELNENSYEFIAFVRPSSYMNFLSDPLVILKFPFTYNTTFNDTFTSNGLGQGVNYTRTYDAYGTMITPFGQFDDVVRVKIVSEGGTRYLWYNTNPCYVLLTGNFDNDSVTFYQELSLGTPQNQKDAFAVYPNPTTADFTIGDQLSIYGHATVYDMSGKTVVEHQDLAASNTISLKNCSAGTYFVKITDANKRVLQTEKIVKQ